MEQTNTPQQPSRKKAILSLLVLLALTCVVVFIFSSHWAEISTALAQLSFWQVLLVLAIGLTYPLLEGIVCWLIIRCRLPGFTLRRGLDAAFVGTFGNVVGLGAGAVPMESYYLYHCGLPLGPGVGLMTLQYVFHKTTVLLYATVMLGQRLARGAMGFLPKTKPWQTRREKWLEQLDTLATESRLLLADKGRCARILAVQTLKLFLMFTLPWFCIRFMGLSCGLSFWQVQLLTSLMLFLSNALPNVAGMGSIETAFLLVFSSFMTSGEAMSTLMLFRIASYYFVFAASAAGTFAAQKHLENS